MAENEDKPETKEPDETDETTEATPEDTVIEVELIEKKEKGMRSETKTALGALLMALISMTYVCWIAFGSNTTNAGALIALITTGLLIHLFIALLVGALIFMIKKIAMHHFCIIGILWLISIIPFIFGVVPLSKYHNQNQIERDKKIVEMLQITALEDIREIRILLPDEHTSEHSYLKKVLSVGWTNDKKAWKDIAIPCRRGNEYWYEAFIDKLALDQTGKKACLILFFDHAWKDYEITKEILLPDSNSL